MEFPEPNNADVDRAGRFLRKNLNGTPGTQEMVAIVSDWRSAHEYALKRVMIALRSHARAREWNALIFGRTKRLNSIVAKLARQPSMALSRMQDIGGCRAVMDRVETAEFLAESVRSRLKTKLSIGGEIREKDYIVRPKIDGYRSLHFVVRYVAHELQDAMKPRQIEIQIRSQLQHYWATALETVDLFTGQKLKIGQGDPRWHRFFSLTSSILASQENCPLVPETPPALSELKEEIRDLAEELGVVYKLQT